MENMPYNQNICENTTRLRKAAGMTQEALASRLGITFQAVSKWDNGLSCPDISLLPQIAEIFGVSIDALFAPPPKDVAAPESTTQQPPHADEAEDKGKRRSITIELPNMQDFAALGDIISDKVNQAVEKISSVDWHAEKQKWEGKAQEWGSKAQEKAQEWGNKAQSWSEQNFSGCETRFQPIAELPWEDDGVIRAVVFVGRNLALDPVPTKEVRELVFGFEGDARDIQSAFSVSCGDVEGGVIANGTVECGEVGGDVKAAGSVNADEISGNVQAGGSVNCDEVGGSVNAGGNVSADDIGGDVKAGGSVTADTIKGSVAANTVNHG